MAYTVWIVRDREAFPIGGRHRSKDDVISFLADELAQFRETQVIVQFPDGSVIETDSWD